MRFWDANIVPTDKLECKECKDNLYKQQRSEAGSWFRSGL